MRKNNVQQMVGERRVLHFKLKLHPGGQKCRSLQKSFDIGVEYFEAIHPETGCDLGIALGEFRAHLAQKGEFGFVMFKQPGIHRPSASVL